MTRDCHLRSRHRLENPAGGERRSRAEPARGERPSRHRGDRAGAREGAFVSRKATRLYHLKTTGRRRTNEDEGERVLSERWEFSESEMELSPFNEKSRICPSAEFITALETTLRSGLLPSTVFHGTDPSLSWPHRPGQVLRARLSGKCHNRRDRCKHHHLAFGFLTWLKDV